MADQQELMVLDLQNMEESGTPVAVNGWVNKEKRRSTNLTYANIKSFFIDSSL